MATTVVKSTIKFKRGSESEWATLNPILEEGEPGYTTDSKKVKIGDGTSHWNNLDYLNNTIKQSLVTLEASNWSNNEMTVTVQGVTSINDIIVSPSPSFQEAYTSAGILCVAQSTNSLTFTCEDTPSVDINVNVLILG